MNDFIEKQQKEARDKIEKARIPEVWADDTYNCLYKISDTLIETTIHNTIKHILDLEEMQEWPVTDRDSGEALQEKIGHNDVVTTLRNKLTSLLQDNHTQYEDTHR